MAGRIEDLHPDDYTARIAIRTQLRAIREATGLSQRDMKELLGLDQGQVSKMERTGVDQSKTATIARWARALGYRLTLTPTGFPPPARRRPDSTNPVAATLAALVETYNVGAFGGADGWLAARTLHDLVGIRIACSVSPAQLARVLGISEQSVILTDRGTGDNQLVMLQRYARGIARASRHQGGYLAAGLEPVDQPEQASTPTKRV